ncbi:MAG TPA: hypothetical protein VFJ82_20930 [Longimicrobium sp.]|nr:hypothetical protein [Longimicrobium sp.]
MSSTAAPPARPAASPRRRADALRLPPPRRGDQVAVAACVVGLVLYAIVIVSLWNAGLIRPESPLLFRLAVGSIAITVLGFVWSLGADVPRLWRDERAIQFLLVAEPAKDPLSELVSRAPRLGARTLAGDLARQVDLARPGGRVPTPAELRGIASIYTAPLGGVARFTSQFLLLLTVLGTFLGVREALPELVRTLGSSTGPGSLSSATLTAALSAVGDAFGSNLGALLGSIALGLAAYGVGAGRRAMLARLELASVRHVYPALERRAARDTDGDLVRQLQEATRSLTSLAGLTDAMRDLKDEVELSSRRTARLLRRALQQERETLLDDTRQQVSGLEALVEDVVRAVGTNAAQYATIADALASRNRDFGATVVRIGEVVEILHRVSDAHGEHVSGMTRDLLRALSEMQISVNAAAGVSSGIREDLEGARGDVQALIGNVTALVTALAAAEAAAGRARQEAAERERSALVTLRERHAAALADADAHQRETLHRVETELVELLSARITPPVHELRASVDTLRGAVDRVPSGTQAGVLEAFRRARAEGTGGGVDDLTRTLERISVLVERLDVPAGQLSAALRQLSNRIGAMERRMSQPLWRRLFRREAHDPGDSFAASYDPWRRATDFADPPRRTAEREAWGTAGVTGTPGVRAPDPAAPRTAPGPSHGWPGGEPSFDPDPWRPSHPATQGGDEAPHAPPSGDATRRASGFDRHADDGGGAAGFVPPSAHAEPGVEPVAEAGSIEVGEPAHAEDRDVADIRSSAPAPPEPAPTEPAANAEVADDPGDAGPVSSHPGVPEESSPDPAGSTADAEAAAVPSADGSAQVDDPGDADPVSSHPGVPEEPSPAPAGPVEESEPPPPSSDSGEPAAAPDAVASETGGAPPEEAQEPSDAAGEATVGTESEDDAESAGADNVAVEREP